MTDATSTSRAAVGMGAIAAASRAAGFVRVLVIAAVLGTTYLGNAFQAANSFSNVLFELLAAGALSAVLVPAFVSRLDAGDGPGAERIAGGVLGAALLGLGAVTIVGEVFAPQLAHLLTIGVPPEVAEDQRDLVTFLLRCFIPQLVLYAAGAIATAILYAKRRFAVTAAAPIGNTVVMIACLLVFRASTGPDPTLDLTSAQRWLLALAGTGGVLAFVGTLLVALHRTGFRLAPRRPGRDPEVRSVLAHSGWGVVLHTGAGMLLGGAIIAGSAVEGGVVAYQVAWVFFLAPYAILAQPIHTAILPELVLEAGDATLDRFGRSIQWAIERMALLVLPVAAGMIALAQPAMRAVTFGAAADNGPELMAAALTGLAVGLFPYGAFLLLARSYYALDDSRTPGTVSVASAAVGVVVMVVGAALTDGATRILVLGLGHSAAQLLAAAALWIGLRRRVGQPLRPVGLGRIVVLATTLAVVGRLASEALLPADPGRLADVVVTAGIGAVGVAIVLGAYRLLGFPGALTPRVEVTGAGEVIV